MLIRRRRSSYIQADVCRLVVDAVRFFCRSVGQLVIVKRAAKTTAQVDGRQVAGIAGSGVVVADLLFVTDDADGIIAFQSGLDAVVQAEHPLRLGRDDRKCYTY